MAAENKLSARRPNNESTGLRTQNLEKSLLRYQSQGPETGESVLYRLSVSKSRTHNEEFTHSVLFFPVILTTSSIVSGDQEISGHVQGVSFVVTLSISVLSQGNPESALAFYIS
jgi:hypothetical protein